MAAHRIEPTRENCSLEELEIAMKCAPTQTGCMRMKAIRALWVGQEPHDVAIILGVTTRTLLRWVKAFNYEGIDGILDNCRPGRPRAISGDKYQEYKKLVENPGLAGEEHWTGRKFHGYLRDELKQAVAYRTVVRWLHEQNFALRIPRPWPDRQDDEARRLHVEQLNQLLQDTTVDIWYADECGFEGDPRPRRRWVQRGSRPTRVKNGDHLRESAMGMLCPRTGEVFSMGFSACDADCFQVFLSEANKSLEKPRETNILILDNASWHKVSTLNWGHFTPLFLPAYSPDLNPIERLWLMLKNVWFTGFVAKDRMQLIERVDTALVWAMASAESVRSMCTMKTKL